MKMTCIICPMGCELRIKTEGEFEVKGHQCPRGIQYAKDEVTNPKRVYTGNITCLDGVLPVISFKTESMLKANLSHLQAIVKQLKVVAPIRLGDILYHDDLLTITATRTIERKA